MSFPVLAFAEPEDRPKQLLGLLPVQEMLLVGCALIGIARRDRNALDVELGRHVVEERSNLIGRHAIEQRSVDVHSESLLAQEPDRTDRLVEHPVLADRFVVMLLEPVQMDREGEVGTGLEPVDLLFDKERIGAEIDEFLLGNDPFDDRNDVFVDQRLAPWDRDDRRTTFVDGCEAFFDA